MGEEDSCSGQKKITIAYQSISLNKVLAIRVNGMELHQLNDEQGKVVFKIPYILREGLALWLNRDEFAGKFTIIFKALNES